MIDFRRNIKASQQNDRILQFQDILLKVKIIFNPGREDVSRGKIPPAYPTVSILQSPEVLQHRPGFFLRNPLIDHRYPVKLLE